jgi:hypothetical protein
MNGGRIKKHSRHTAQNILPILKIPVPLPHGYTEPQCPNG